MDPDRRAFYEYHSCMMEPWDGPASMCFSNGDGVGAVLDRNGLRPSRYIVTKDGLLVMGSEVGTLKIDPADIERKGRLEPGRIFYVDLEEGRIIEDAELKDRYIRRQPYGPGSRRIASTLDGSAAGRADPSAESRDAAPAPAGVRVHARGSALPDRADGGERQGGARVDGRGLRHSPACPTSPDCCSSTSSRTSPRSRIRRSIRSASDR